MNNIIVGINDFVRRQVKGTGKTYSSMSYQEIAKYAENKLEGIKLLEFLASPEGSSGLALPTYEHPLTGFNQSPEVKTFGGFTPDKVSITQLGKYNSKAIDLMTKAGWE